jgi:LysR family transcriptional regulator, nitrogen assimilation regulatory protein
VTSKRRPVGTALPLVELSHNTMMGGENISNWDTHMDIRQLRYFVAVAEHGSFSAAASAINVAQSALSKHMKQLENQLGGSVFERGARGVQLSESGRILLDRARYLLDQFDSVIAEVSSENSEVSGTVRLGVPSSLADILYEPLARRITTHFPRIRLRLATGLTEDLNGRILKGALDVAIVTEPRPNKHLEYQELFREQNYLIGPSKDPFFKRKSVVYKDLLGLKMILPLSADERERFPIIDAAIHSDSVTPMKRMAAAGLGYALLPHSGISAELANGTLGATIVLNSAATRTLVLPRGRPIARATREVLGNIKLECSTLIREGTIRAQKLHTARKH